MSEQNLRFQIETLSSSEIANSLAMNGSDFCFQLIIDKNIDGIKLMQMTESKLQQYRTILSPTQIKQLWTHIFQIQKNIAKQKLEQNINGIVNELETASSKNTEEIKPRMIEENGTKKKDLVKLKTTLSVVQRKSKPPAPPPQLMLWNTLSKSQDENMNHDLSIKSVENNINYHNMPLLSSTSPPSTSPLPPSTLPLPPSTPPLPPSTPPLPPSTPPRPPKIVQNDSSVSLFLSSQKTVWNKPLPPPPPKNVENDVLSDNLTNHKFYRTWNREKCITMLKNRPVGAFLLRKSTTHYATFVVKGNRKIFNVPIIYLDKLYNLRGSTECKFVSINEMVEYYKNENLMLSNVDMVKLIDYKFPQ